MLTIPSIVSESAAAVVSRREIITILSTAVGSNILFSGSTHVAKIQFIKKNISVLKKSNVSTILDTRYMIYSGQVTIIVFIYLFIKCEIVQLGLGLS